MYEINHNGSCNYMYMHSITADFLTGDEMNNT